MAMSLLLAETTPRNRHSECGRGVTVRRSARSLDGERDLQNARGWASTRRRTRKRAEESSSARGSVVSSRGKTGGQGLTGVDAFGLAADGRRRW